MDTIHIKNSWKEVTIGEFMAIQELDPNDYDNELYYYIELLAILSDKDIEYFYNIPLFNIPKLIEPLSFLSTRPEGDLDTTYRINGKKYKLSLDLRNFTAIQYIDLVTLLKGNQNNKNLHMILAVLMQEKGKKYNTDGYDVQEAAKEIRDHFNIADAYTLSLFFFDSFKEFNQGYPELFNLGNEEETEEGDRSGDEEEADDNDQPDGGFNAKWGWIYYIDIVAEKTRSTWEATQNMNVVAFLNILSYIKDKNVFDRAQIKKQVRR